MSALARRKLVLVVAVVLVYAAALGLPALIPDGPAGLTGQEYEAAATAHQLAYATLWENQLERLWIRQTRVLSVVAGEEPGDSAAGQLAPGWEVRVKAYALFGLPYSEITVEHRGGSVEYRLPTGLAAGILLLALPVYACVVLASDER